MVFVGGAPSCRNFVVAQHCYSFFGSRRGLSSPPKRSSPTSPSLILRSHRNTRRFGSPKRRDFSRGTGSTRSWSTCAVESSPLRRWSATMLTLSMPVAAASWTPCSAARISSSIASPINQEPQVLVTRREIKELAQLKGKKFAVNSLIGPAMLSLKMILAASGLDPERDVSYLAVGPSSSRFGALQLNQVDATTLAPPFTFAARRGGLQFFRRSSGNERLGTA